MFHLIKFVAIALLVSSSYSSKLSRRAINVVNGSEVQPKFKYSFVVNVQLNGLSYCGGTLYKSDVVITAAHCASREASRYMVLTHRHDLTKSTEEEGGSSYPVKSIVKHPDYAPGYRNDIALFKLESNANKNFEPSIQLDTYDLSGYSGLMLTVVGWGANVSGGFNSNYLQQVELPVFKSNQCNVNYKSIGESVDSSLQFCAGYSQGKKDACQGDSGGPLFLNFQGKYYLVGIVSWGVGCADPNLPGVYTKVNHYLHWINKNV